MLTAKQERFCQAIIEGMTQADAYRTAYSAKKMTAKTIQEAASRLMADSKISARVDELRERLTSAKIMSAKERLEWLTDIINNGDERTDNRLKAIDLMNKMQGEYVTKVDANVNADVNINIELSDDE
jgi:phage terminase small subunit